MLLPFTIMKLLSDFCERIPCNMLLEKVGKECRRWNCERCHAVYHWLGNERQINHFRGPKRGKERESKERGKIFGRFSHLRCQYLWPTRIRIVPRDISDQLQSICERRECPGWNTVQLSHRPRPANFLFFIFIFFHRPRDATFASITIYLYFDVRVFG